MQCRLPQLRRQPSALSRSSGREVAGLLDLLYSGWVERNLDCMDIEEWLVTLSNQLSVIHDVASATEAKAIENRVSVYNKGKCDRIVNVGDSVLMRVPGLHAALQAS